METQSKNSRKCDICDVDVHWASFAKHLKSKKKHLENKKQMEMITHGCLFQETIQNSNKIQNTDKNL